MRDFTLAKYNELLLAFQAEGYAFLTFGDYCTAEHLPGRYVILRHDVDKRPQNSIATAEIENGIHARASYYFRIVPESNQPDAIRRIAAFGHEIGYHYEDMALAHGDIDKAFAHFEQWLAYFRTYYPVCTVCMHGAPTSRYDGRDLWKKYDYHKSGIVGEPYFDVDFSQVFYLTDTGRCWDGYKVSVRDKIPVWQDEWVRLGLTWHTTDDMIQALEEGTLPDRIMMTTHPQRWAASNGQWAKELIIQNLKNIVKRILIYAKADRH